MLTIFTRFGFPAIILSDNGTQFKSHITAAFTEMYKITQVFSARYRPQSNGMVERMNQTVKLMLKKVVQDKQSDCDRFLPMVLFAYREVPQDATGYSPFQLVFGGNPKGIFELFKTEMLEWKTKPMSPYELVARTREEIMYAILQAQINSKKSAETNRK